MDHAPIRTTPLGRIGRVIIAFALVAFVAACGGGGGTTNPPATAGPATAGPPATGGAGLTLEVATATAGSHVAGAGGKALYVFTPDKDAPGKSVCNDDCATNWPPLTVADVSEVTAGTGVTGALGTITRDDGSTQVTLAGNPLYYFANDAAAGDTNGQGVNDVWWLAGPDGAAVGAPATGGGDFRY